MGLPLRDRPRLGDDNSIFFFLDVRFNVRAYIFSLSRIMVDLPLNEQHEWGGSPFQPTSNDDTGGQTFLPSRPIPASSEGKKGKS